MASDSLTKKRTAELLGNSRSSLYYIPKQPTKDEHLKKEILQVLLEHPGYGYRRVALTLSLNKKQVQRVMQKFSLQQKRKRRKKYKDPESTPSFMVENHLKQICPLTPGIVWQTDFTYLMFKNRTLYMATVVDRVSREILGIAVSFRHSGHLVREALQDAVLHHSSDNLYCVHSDQGSEYLAEDTRNFIISLGALPSFLQHQGFTLAEWPPGEFLFSLQAGDGRSRPILFTWAVISRNLPLYWILQHKAYAFCPQHAANHLETNQGSIPEHGFCV